MTTPNVDEKPNLKQLDDNLIDIQAWVLDELNNYHKV